MFDLSNCGKILRGKVAMMLGIWHPYKDANMLLWKRFGHTFLAPLFHILYPAGIFHTKSPRLTSILSLLSLVRLSYPKWRANLIEVMECDDVHRELKGHLRNLWDLCEFFIPTVSVFVGWCCSVWFKVVQFANNDLL